MACLTGLNTKKPTSALCLWAFSIPFTTPHFKAKQLTPKRVARRICQKAQGDKKVPSARKQKMPQRRIYTICNCRGILQPDDAMGALLAAWRFCLKTRQRVKKHRATRKCPVLGSKKCRKGAYIRYVTAAAFCSLTTQWVLYWRPGGFV